MKNYLLQNIKYFYLLLCLLQLNCQDSNNTHQDLDPVISSKNIEILKERYTSKEINYFYETIFYNDADDRIEKSLKKWNQNVSLFVENASKNDEIQTKKGIAKINSLGLPIRINIVDESEKSNVKIIFGDKEYLSTYFKQSGFFGIGQLRDRHGEIKGAKIGITDAFVDGSLRKEAVILEELTQILGITGDSYSHPNSIFYQGHNMPIHFSELDKKVCQLLYDPLIPVNYSLKNFKKDFAEELYSVDHPRKIKTFLKDKVIEKKLLLKINETCFDKGIFYKHPKNIPVYINGEYTATDSIFLDKIIKCFNKVSDNINMFRASKNDAISESGIYLNYKIQEDIPHKVMSKIYYEKGYTLFPKLIKSEIEVLYKDVLNVDKVRNRNMLETLYRAVTSVGHKSFKKDWYQISKGEIIINDEYKKLMNIVYNDIFIDGLKQYEFEKIIKSLYP